MANKITIRFLEVGEEYLITDLILKVFFKYNASSFLPIGIESFVRIVEPQAIKDRTKDYSFVLVAIKDSEIVGMIEVKWFCHISLLFVDENFHKQGIGRQLFQNALKVCRSKNPQLYYITVYSSEYAVSIYKKLGFIDFGNRHEYNGIVTIPLKYTIA